MMKRIRERWHCGRCHNDFEIEALPVTAAYCPKGHRMRRVATIEVAA